MMKISDAIRIASNAVAVLLFGSLLLTIAIQIASRHAFSAPIGWTTEVAGALFVSVVFWCNAFTLRVRQHVIFDLIFQSVGRRVQNILIALSYGFMAGLFVYILPANLEYFKFLGDGSEKTGVLELDFRLVFLSYFLFSIVFPIRLLVEAYTFIKLPPASD